jgi:hypothetical protein
LVGNHDGYVPNAGKAGVVGCAAEATPGPSISAAAMAAPPSDDATAKRFRSFRNLMVCDLSFVVIALVLMRLFRAATYIRLKRHRLAQLCERPKSLESRRPTRIEKAPATWWLAGDDDGCGW